MATRKNDQKEPVTMVKRFTAFCVTVLAGVVLLYLAVQLLSQFWGWLVLLAVVAVTIYIGIRVAGRRRDRW
jgi:Flp pilus assembly protein TadB